MAVLSNAAAKDIDPDLAELINIRASQMNHCAFCLDMHTADARKRGISEQLPGELCSGVRYEN
jgi:AhpD family alkylhydroperoxidase